MVQLLNTAHQNLVLLCLLDQSKYCNSSGLCKVVKRQIISLYLFDLPEIHFDCGLLHRAKEALQGYINRGSSSTVSFQNQREFN